MRRMLAKGVFVFQSQSGIFSTSLLSCARVAIPPRRSRVCMTASCCFIFGDGCRLGRSFPTVVPGARLPNGRATAPILRPGEGVPIREGFMFGLHSIGFSNGTVLGQVVQSGWIVARRGELWKSMFEF